MAESTANGNRRGAVAALAAMVVLVGIGWLLAHVLAQSTRMQDCLLSGRTNCAAIELQR